MICLNEAPKSLWKFPDDPVCPNWQPTEAPVPLSLNVYRANTLEYKTPATVCKCVKSKISRRLGLFGSQMEEITTENVNVPISVCNKMKESNISQAGRLVGIFGPSELHGVLLKFKTVMFYETVVFTHFGVDSLNTPIGSCPECNYKAGSCKCTQGSLLWIPDKTQQCAFIPIANWHGEFASGIWISEFSEFALTFENIAKRIDCGQKEMIISDQGYAISKYEYEKIINLINTNNKMRNKREAVKGNDSQTDLVGVVYTSQLESQLTALSAKLTRTTQKLFAESVKQICNALQTWLIKCLL
uniref:Uncharacterized protein n=1 Tax=Meloidogyne enterolobii TaxID=390850 RepID=A0A6V7WJM1_MELEN|nr:unnamed protein product [Meloidogyne enterolobii]